MATDVIHVDLLKTGGKLPLPQGFPDAPPKPPEAAPPGPPPVVAKCKACGGDPTVDPKAISPDTALNFMQAVCSGLPYTETVRLLGGAITLVLRDPASSDETEVSNTILDETVAGKFPLGIAGAAAAFRRATQLRLTTAVESLKYGPIEYRRDPSVRLTESCVRLENSITSTTVRDMVQASYDKFADTLARLREMAADVSFFEAIVPGGYSPEPRTAATRR